MSNEWNWHVNSLQTRLNDLQSTIDSIKTCVERRPGLDAATRAIAALIEASAQSENALQEFPIALSQILSDPSIGSLLIGPQGEIVLYNATAEQVLGREYMQDRALTNVQFSVEDRSKRLLAEELPWAKAIKGEALPDVRLHLSRPGTQEIWLNVSATPFRSTQGAVTGAVVFLIDTTEEVQLEGSITTLCDTIHEQISQVGDTQTQLRDLAERLSGTGIQRLLGDTGTPAPPPRLPEDPNRKKSHPRREASVSSTATRQVALPQPTKKSDAEPPKKGFDAERVVIPTPPPLPAARQEPDVDLAEVTVPSALQSTEIKPPATTIDPLEDSTAEQDSFSALAASTASASALSEIELTPITDVYEEVQSYIEEEEGREQTQSGSWAVVVPQESERINEQSVESSPLDSIDAQKTLELEAIDALVDPTTAVTVSDEGESLPEEFPSEAVLGNLPEIQSQQSSELMNSEPTVPARWSSEYSAFEAAPESTPEPLAVAPPEEAPKSDFWVSGYSPEAAAAEASAKESAASATDGDEVGDSAKSLFGKFANLTKDSYGEVRPEEEKEPDPALPWPELVDGQDYGEPLWDEYTQSEEETTPWQQDKVEESVDVIPAPYMVPEEDADDVIPAPYMVPEEEFAAASVGQEYTASASTEVSGENGEGDHFEEAVAEASPYASTEADAEDEFLPLNSSSKIKPFAVDEYVEPASEPEVTNYAEPKADASESPADYALPARTEEEDDIHGFSKPAALKGKPRPSASYNKLKPLHAAQELEGSFLTEGLTEKVVRFSNQESVPEEEGPKRVLVVDDIPVNQKLLLLHLKRLGYEADVASNGQEALDMLADKSYSLILMDCDMPVMSGFEASSRIRSNEAYSHGRIPIIALTSYDRDGDKEKCIAAGMDDYITKGASQKELKETIERSFVSARLKVANPDDDIEDEADMAPPDINAMLKMYGKEEVEEISRLFLSNMGSYIESMQFAIDNKDGDSVSHYANAVKGPCAALGMRLMTRLTSDIMAYAESQDWTQVRVKYMRLKAVFVQTREELKKVCPDDSLLAT